MKKIIVGIDEAGRGPLAGPVTVGAFACALDFDISVFKNLKDSKKLSEKRREEIFAQIKRCSETGAVDFAVDHVSNKIIDSQGITKAVSIGICKCLKKLSLSPDATTVLLDGLLKAPADYLSQQTIIKGDEKVPHIALASICAKVSRDRLMKRAAKKYPAYGFEVHKGYGTDGHRRSICAHGLSEFHRKSFARS